MEGNVRGGIWHGGGWREFYIFFVGEFAGVSPF